MHLTVNYHYLLAISLRASKFKKNWQNNVLTLVVIANSSLNQARGTRIIVHECLYKLQVELLPGKFSDIFSAFGV
jgi:hypothetical protein